MNLTPFGVKKIYSINRWNCSYTNPDNTFLNSNCTYISFLILLFNHIIHRTQYRALCTLEFWECSPPNIQGGYRSSPLDSSLRIIFCNEIHCNRRTLADRGGGYTADVNPTSQDMLPMIVKITLCMIVGLQPTMGVLYDRPNEKNRFWRDHLGSKIIGGILGGIKSIFEPKWSPILMYG